MPDGTPILVEAPIRAVDFCPSKVYLIHTDRSPNGFVATAASLDGQLVLESGAGERRRVKPVTYYADDSTVTGPFNSIPAAVTYRRNLECA